MRIKILVGLIAALLAGCWIASGQVFVGRPFKPLGPSCTEYVTAETAVLDGTNDWIEHSDSNVVGLASSKAVTLSFWVKFNGTGNQQIVQQYVGTSANIRFQFYRNSDTYTFQARNSANSTILNGTGPNTFNSTNWTHVLFAVDLASTNSRGLFVNGDPVAVNWATYVDDTIQFERPTATFPSFRIGNNQPNTLRLNAALAELWMDDVFTTNVAAFYCGGHPADLGLNGELPTGNAPALYLSLNGDGDSWAVDSSGNGNLFTITGALGTTTSP